MADLRGSKTESGSETSTSTAADVEFSNLYRNGYIYNSGANDATIYVNTKTADDSAKAQTIPSGFTYNFNLLTHGVKGFRHKSTSGTTLLWHGIE